MNNTIAVPYNYIDRRREISQSIRDSVPSGDYEMPSEEEIRKEAQQQYIKDTADLIAHVNSLPQLVKDTLNLYIEYLNQGQEEDTKYTLDDFFKYEGTSDRGFYWSRHYETSGISELKTGTTRFLHMTAGTADDGGAAELFVLVEERYDEVEIISITQQFDTLFSLVYFNSSYTNAREVKERGIIPLGWHPQESPREDSQD